jgi:DNA-binding NarL/FixJ family response regulator
LERALIWADIPGEGGGAVLRVIIADDHGLMVEGTKRALEQAGGFEVVGEATNGAQVLPLVRRLKPDLVLLDLRMPQMDGLTCLTNIRKEFPDMKVAILSVSQDPEVIQTVLKRGANAYIVKTVSPEDLPAALRQAVEGTVFTAVGVSEEPGERAAKEAGLTERELVIVRAVARGLSNDAIAKELWVAEQTVKFHLTNIYRKLDVSNRTEAARYAFEQGLLDHDAAPPPSS